MFRHKLMKVVIFPAIRSWRRPYYSAWHIADMNEKDDRYMDYVRDLWNRRTFIGPDEAKPRSQKFLWNYEAELFAFGKRLGEEFKLPTLRQAFRHASYKPESSVDENDTPQSPTEIDASVSNQEFIARGDQLIHEYVPAYLRYHFPKLPEEGIRAISAPLCSQKQLAYLAKNLGIYDLILAADFPYSESISCDTFKAVVGALAMDSGEQRAEYFIQDFILTELIDMDINEIFYVKNPMKILSVMLEKSGRSSPEPRILRQSGTFTVVPVYLIGIYVDGQLLGQAPGETIEIAEDMAARDCLKTLWNTHHEKRSPLTFGQKSGHALDLQPFKNRQNESLKSYIDFENNEDILDNCDGIQPPSAEDMYLKYKYEIEPALGKVYRKIFGHAFAKGSIRKYCRRDFIAPNVKTI